MTDSLHHDMSLQRTAIVVSSLASFLTPFMASAVNVALPAVSREFSLDAVTLGWVQMAYQLAAAMFLVPFGRLADIVGRKKVFALGLAIDGTASAVCALAPSAAVLIGFRALQGVGGAMIFGTGVAILTSVYPPGERGKALGINTAAVYLGLSIGPVVGGFLTHGLGWRSILWTYVPLSLTALALTVTRLKGEWAEARGESFDRAGAVVYGAGIVALMFGFSRLPSRLGFVLAAAGTAAIALFIWLEGRAAKPLLETRLFRHNRIFAFSNLAAFINYSATAATGFILSLYLQYVKGLPPHRAGLVLIAQPILMAVSSPFAGRLSDRTEPQTIASLGIGLSSVGLFLFAFIREGTPLALVVAGLALLGLGFGLFASPNTNAVMGAVERRLYGVAAASLGTMRLSGQMLSLGITMLILAVTMGRVAIRPENLPSFLRSARIAFSFYAALCVVGVFASLARGKRNGNNAAPSAD
jgi:EmrB/QacA subfamily drug resistance transporter